MTIAEAVELYNEVRDKIKKMDKLMARIFVNNQPSFIDPLQIDHFYVRANDMQEIADFLTEYKEYLKKVLDATFEPGDTGNG